MSIVSIEVGARQVTSPAYSIVSMHAKLTLTLTKSCFEEAAKTSVLIGHTLCDLKRALMTQRKVSVCTIFGQVAPLC